MLCRKSSFESKEQAEKALEQIIKSPDKREKTPRRSYKCPNCGKYHLSSMKKSEHTFHSPESQQKRRIIREAEYFARKSGWDFEE